MAEYFAVVQRELGPDTHPNAQGCGPLEDQTWLNIVTDTRVVPKGPNDSGLFADMVASGPYADPGHFEFAVQISEAQHFQFQGDQIPKRHDGFANLPMWQQRVAWLGGARVAAEFGSFADPRSLASAWRDYPTPIDDPRDIVRVYSGVPDPDDASVNHIASADLDQGSGRQVFYITVFNPSDVRRAGFNQVDRKTTISGVPFIFDFGSTHTPPLDGGMSSFGVQTNDIGDALLATNGMMRVVGPSGERDFRARVWGRDLPIRR